MIIAHSRKNWNAWTYSPTRLQLSSAGAISGLKVSTDRVLNRKFAKLKS